MTATPGAATPSASRANVGLVLAVVAALAFIVAIIVAQEENSWLWPVSGLLGLAGAVTGWTAGKPRPQGRALAAVVIGGLVFLFIAGWVVWAAATGNL